MVWKYRCLIMHRFYTDTIKADLLDQRQMLFTSGSKQVGKTTIRKLLV